MWNQSMAIGVLFASVCTILMAGSVSGGWLWKNQPVKELSDYLYEIMPSLESDGDFEKLKQLLVSVKNGRRLGQKPKQLAELLIQLNTEDPCAASNIELLRRVIADIEYKEKDAFKESPDKCSLHLVSKLLINYTNDVIDVCVDVFESKWVANGGEIKNEFKLQFDDYMGPLDIINEMHASGVAMRNWRTDLAQFSGAIGRGGNLNKLDNFNFHLKAVLMNIQGILTGDKHFKRDPGSGRALAVTVSEASEILDKNLLGPCKQMVEREDTSTIVKPVADLIQLMMFDCTKRVSAGTYSTFRWAARYVSCNWFLSLNKDELANRIVQEHRI